MAFTNVYTEVPGSPIFLMRMVSKVLEDELQTIEEPQFSGGILMNAVIVSRRNPC